MTRITRHRSLRSLAGAAVILVAALADPAWAKGRSGAGMASGAPPPKHRLHFTSLTGLSLNPEGLETRLRVGYRRRLFNSRSILFKDSFAGAFVVTKLNPAFARVGLGVELQPFILLTLRLQYEVRGYFGTVGAVQTFPGPWSEHHSDLRRERRKRGEHYATYGHELSLYALLRAKFGPVILLNHFRMTYFHLATHSGDTTFYDQGLVILNPARGVVVANDVNLLSQTPWPFFLPGVRLSLVHALYAPRFGAPELPRGSTPTIRFGPLIAFRLRERGMAFRTPTLFLFATWWIRHRYRAGQRHHQAIPFVVAAFQFTGDFWRSGAGRRAR